MPGILTTDENGYITGAQHQQWTTVYENLKATLSAAASRRDSHADAHAPVVSVDADGEPTQVPFFIDFEMRAMLAQINDHRARHGHDPVVLADVARVERRACGHSDYSSKYALYCADLVCYGPDVAHR